MREGEALGLRWEDVDLDAGIIGIHKSFFRRGSLRPRMPCPCSKLLLLFMVPTVKTCLRHYPTCMCGLGLVANAAANAIFSVESKWSRCYIVLE